MISQLRSYHVSAQALIRIHFRASRCRRFVSRLLVLLTLTWAGQEVQAEPDAPAKPHQVLMPQRHMEIVQKYCFDCHDSTSQLGNVDLETLNANIAADNTTAGKWADVLAAINSGEMPPEDADPISGSEKLEFLKALSVRMVTARKVLSDNGGATTLRRLNRREYGTTVQALTGVFPDISRLPSDGTGIGFDTFGDSLYLSGDQIEAYFQIAKETLQRSLKRNKRKTWSRRIEPELSKNKLFAEHQKRNKDLKKSAQAYIANKNHPAKKPDFADLGDAKKTLKQSSERLPQFVEYLKQPQNKTGTSLISTIQPGMTRISTPTFWGHEGYPVTVRMRVGAYPNATEQQRYLEISRRSHKSKEQTLIGWRKVSGTLKNPDLVEFTVDIPAGDRAVIDVQPRSHQGRGDKNLWDKHMKETGRAPAPGLWVDWVEFKAPEFGQIPGAWILAGSGTAKKNQDQFAKQVIARFARRAFRTAEPSADYLQRLFDIYLSKRSQGKSFVDALIDPLAVVLSSPKFLYMVQLHSEERWLSQPEIAVRLSYFLWSAPPDEELWQLAQSGGLLKSRAALKRQVSRLLNDKRSNQFYRSFVDQWLGLDRLGMFQFNAVRYETFDNATRENARQEIYETLRYLTEENLPLGHFLKSDFVVVNDVLADYYGIGNVDGPEFRRVNLPQSLSHRGGVLGMAAFHAMGSDGFRTNPVERGAWVLRHLLNDPPPPAPANVPQLSRFDRQVLSSRSLQQLHQEQPQCAQCHQKIDPIGFGLENFDAAGNWRDQETVYFTERRKKKTREFDINPRGEIKGCGEFSGFVQLRDLVAKQEQQFARGIIEELIAYAMGRPFGFSDEPLVDEIIGKTEGNQLTLPEILMALVTSKSFLRSQSR